MIFLASHNDVEWNSMRDGDGDYVNDATVTGALKDGDGIALGTFALTYVTGSNGNYKGAGVITPAMLSSVADCQQLTVELTATGTFTGFRKFEETTGYRGKS